MYSIYSSIKKRLKKILVNFLDAKIIQNEKDKVLFTTYWDRPKFTDEIQFFTNSYSDKNIAILLQGQVLTNDHFTFETVKYYRRLYPLCPIIISTWNNENFNELETIRKHCNVTIIQNEYPKNPGIGNINFQRKNTLEGIKFAKKLGCKYILKTRTDQRMYAKNSILFLKTLIDKFPLRIKCKAEGRIAACSIGTLNDRLYNICDMLLFGYIDDLYNYFNTHEAPIFSKEFVIPNEKLDPVGYAKIRPGEIYFATNYIENCGYNLKWTFEDSNYYRNELFIIFDSESVDLFWPKYNRREYIWRSYDTDNHDVVTFKEWLINQNEK